MKSKLCSVLIPSRGKPFGLLKAIKSVNDTVNDPSRIEILVGLDDDDEVSKTVWDDLMGIENVSVFVWPRDWIAMISGLAQAAEGDWILILNDDATIEGSGWDEQLANTPKAGVVYQPETYRLNESRYLHATRTGFPWFPNRCWEIFGCAGNFIPFPADYEVCNLAEKHGWEIRFLTGITVFHDRHGSRAAGEIATA